MRSLIVTTKGKVLDPFEVVRDEDRTDESLLATIRILRKPEVRGMRDTLARCEAEAARRGLEVTP